jgi:NAD(P)-dependent dehydrogenase (short-subunit alcohol dehydrogenase family)
MTLAGKTALVTGASRGVGRGIAQGLGEAGATVYVTGRTSCAGRSPGAAPVPGTVEAVAAEVDRLGGHGVPVRCDHAVDAEVEALIARIESESGRLDILVNNANEGVGDVGEHVRERFWEIDPAMWDRVNGVGLRGHYVASVHAARAMVRRRSGLIVNVSSVGAVSYLFNAAYGTGKAALDRLTADMALELRPMGVAVVSLWPGLVRTELTATLFAEAAPRYRRLFETCAESPLLSGRAVAAIAADPAMIRRTGLVAITAEVAHRHGVSDEGGRRPVSLRSLRTVATALLPAGAQPAAALVPPIRLPLWVVARALRRFSLGVRRA